MTQAQQVLSDKVESFDLDTNRATSPTKDEHSINELQPLQLELATQPENSSESTTRPITTTSTKSSSHTRTPSSAPLLDNVDYSEEDDDDYTHQPIRDSDNSTSSLSKAFNSSYAYISKNKGLICIFLSCIPFAIATSLVKSLEESPSSKMPVWEIVFVRMLLTSPLCVLTGYASKISEPVWGPQQVRFLLFIRGSFGFLSVLAFYTSLQFLPASEAVVISFLAPVVSGILAAILLKESLEKRNIVSALTAFLGVLLIAKPPFLFGNKQEVQDDEPNDKSTMTTTMLPRVIGVCLGLFAVLTNSFAILAIRRIGHQASSLHFLQYFAIASIVGSPFCAFILPSSRPSNPFKSITFIKMIALVLFAYLGQILQAMGIQHEKVGRCLLVSYLQLPFIILLEVVIFDQKEDALSLAGAFIIIGSAIHVAIGQDNNSSKENNNSNDNNNDNSNQNVLRSSA